MLAVTKNTFISFVDSPVIPRGRLSSPSSICTSTLTLTASQKSSISAMSMGRSQLSMSYHRAAGVSAYYVPDHRLKSALGDLAHIYMDALPDVMDDSMREEEDEEHRNGRETVCSRIPPSSMPTFENAPWDGESLDYSLLPTVGSALHGVGQCSPCAFVHKDRGCAEGYACQYCHLCNRSDYIARRKLKAKSGKLKKRNEARERREQEFALLLRRGGM